MDTKPIGRQGEEIATEYLIRNNYKILERNYFCRKGEIDIIAQDTTSYEIVFVEVKTRRQTNYGLPVEAINKYKIKNLYNSAKYYIFQKKLEECASRFDAIEIYLKNEKYYLHHILNYDT